MSVPPPIRATTNSTAAIGATTRPSSRKRARQPQIRYAVTTNQTKRFSDPAHVDHGKPSARAAWAISSAVCSSQPTRMPHVASRPGVPGARVSRKYAKAASPYANNTGQKRSSATRPRPLHQLGDGPLEPRQLRRDDQEVREQDDEHDEVRGRHVLLLGAHPSSSRSSRRLASRRFPASASRYSAEKSDSMAARQTQNVRNCDADICGPCLLNATGWMYSLAS